MHETAWIRTGIDGRFTVSFHLDQMPAHSVEVLQASTVEGAIREAQQRWPRFHFRRVTEADDADGDVVAVGA